MSSKLTSFLTELSTNSNLVEQFKENPDEIIKKYNISSEHHELIKAHKYDEIQAILGADFSISKNTIIKAYKK